MVLREGGGTIQTDQDPTNKNPSNSDQATIVKSGCDWIHVAHDKVDPIQVAKIILESEQKSGQF